MATSGFNGSVDAVALAKIADYAGSDYGLATPDDWRVSVVAGQDRTVNVAGGTGYGHFILDEGVPGKQIQLDPLDAGKRWDLIVRRRTWQPTSGTSDFAKVTGVAGTDPQPSIPAGRLVGPGVQDDQLLALVQVVAGQPAPAQIIDLRSWASKVFTASTLLALPDADVGAEAVVGDLRYRRIIDAASNPAWVSTAKSAPAVRTDVVTPAAGFIIDAAFVNNCAVDATGKDVEYRVQLRRTGASFKFGSDGGLGDMGVATLTGPLPDANAGGYALPVQFRAVGGPADTSTIGLYCTGYLRTDGLLVVESGIPNSYISRRTQTGLWSLVALIKFRKA